MKKTRTPITILMTGIFLISSMTFCSDDEILNTPENEKEEENEFLEINQFIDENMSIYYFWNEEMPDINPENESDPEKYFNKLLKEEDRWSFITDDYQNLVNYFAGIQKSTGYSLLPMYLEENSNQVIAFIEYVHRNSPAEDAGLKRGDMIYKIDDQIMTDQNYSDLLNRTIFDITLAEFDSNGNVNELSSDISIEAIELNMHPVIGTNVIDTLGHRIGYLAYSSFVANYDSALVNTLGWFKDEGVTEMVLDLRYNGGGSVASAALLADMLVPGGNTGNTFIQTVYNDLLMKAFEEEQEMTADSFNITFEEHPNNLDLNNLFVLTTQSTASASEMIIYGLDPYMNIIQVGDTTVGKYYGSSTFSDEDNHDWAIQPIILLSKNATDNINYLEGLKPDHKLRDLFYLFPPVPLGDPEEYFMAKTISLITGEPFIYEDLENSLKSAGKISDTRNNKLKNKLYPNRSEMWVEWPDEMPVFK